jgi:hypothetical protein
VLGKNLDAHRVRLRTRHKQAHRRAVRQLGRIATSGASRCPMGESGLGLGEALPRARAQTVVGGDHNLLALAVVLALGSFGRVAVDFEGDLPCWLVACFTQSRTNNLLREFTALMSGPCARMRLESVFVHVFAGNVKLAGNVLASPALQYYSASST